ncbi:hypothetical protein [Sphingomonas sp.]|uniref:hypothetical protein n=1 Tax=Sphingomonas sp. TaxID=28214 RepID=UPI0035BC6A55
MTFRSWLVARLEEFEPADLSAGRLRAARAAALETALPALAEALHTSLSRIDFVRVGQRYALKAMQMTKGGRSPDLKAIERAMSNDAEALASGRRRRGPARRVDPDDQRRAVIRAAWDVWLIRVVILPRFWPERRGRQVHLPGGEAEYKRIIAQRYAASRHDAAKLAQLAWSEYRKAGLAQAWTCDCIRYNTVTC